MFGVLISSVELTFAKCVKPSEDLRLTYDATVSALQRGGGGGHRGVVAGERLVAKASLPPSRRLQRGAGGGVAAGQAGGGRNSLQGGRQNKTYQLVFTQ